MMTPAEKAIQQKLDMMVGLSGGAEEVLFRIVMNGDGGTDLRITQSPPVIDQSLSAVTLEFATSLTLWKDTPRAKTADGRFTLVGPVGSMFTGVTAVAFRERICGQLAESYRQLLLADWNERNPDPAEVDLPEGK